MGLATPITTQFSLCRDGLKMASPIGLAIFSVCRDRLKGYGLGSGKSHGTCHFQNVSTQAERVSYMEWQEPVLATLEAC